MVDRREAAGKIVQKIDTVAGRARCADPRRGVVCSFPTVRTGANFSIQFPDGSHKDLFMKCSPRVRGERANASPMGDAREMRTEEVREVRLSR